jgi:hypothetical protein
MLLLQTQMLQYLLPHAARGLNPPVPQQRQEPLSPGLHALREVAPTMAAVGEQLRNGGLLGAWGDMACAG